MRNVLYRLPNCLYPDPFPRLLSVLTDLIRGEVRGRTSSFKKQKWYVLLDGVKGYLTRSHNVTCSSSFYTWDSVFIGDETLLRPCEGLGMGSFTAQSGGCRSLNHTARNDAIPEPGSLGSCVHHTPALRSARRPGRMQDPRRQGLVPVKGRG